LLTWWAKAARLLLRSGKWSMLAMDVLVLQFSAGLQTLASENFPDACRIPAFSVPTAVDLPIRPLRTP
jgi:hypothetical protein